VALLMLQCVLGAAFFADLILMLLDRIDIVLRAWLAGLLVAGAVRGVATAMSVDSERAALASGAALVLLVLVLLLIAARRVVTTAMSH
jgi:hypothetical protein